MAKLISIRGIDLELWRKAKAQAALEGKSLAQWITEAIQRKLLAGKM